MKEKDFIREDRIFPLKDAVSYPGKDFIDMVFYYPPIQKKKRLWLLTEAPSPHILIDHYEFKPVRIKEGKYRWIDFGITDIPFCTYNGFGQIKFYGVNKREAENSYFVITTQIEKELNGSIENVEKKLWGLKRKEVGKTLITPCEIVVGSPTVFHLIYECSSKGLPPESYIRFTIPRAFAFPQIRNKNKDGYFAIHSDRECKVHSIDVSIESHEKNDVILYLPDGLPPYGRIEIKYRTDFTYLFNSTFNEVERRYWYSKLPPLCVAVSIKKYKNFVPPLKENSHVVNFVADRPERIHLFVPGRRREGKKINVVGIITDKYRNPVKSALGRKIRLRIEGRINKEIGNIKTYFTSHFRFEVPLSISQKGIYRIKAIDEDTGEIVAVSNPVEIMERKDKRSEIYWGEIHGHCEMSDGSGDFVEMIKGARDIGYLDFAASADHACYFTDNQWEWMQDILNYYNTPGKFCTLIGYEWAGRQGHRNIYTSSERLKLFRGMYEPTSSIDVVYKEFEGRKDIVAGPHTCHTGDFWSYHNPDVERFIEIYSMWGHFDTLANKLLNEGAILGFTGGGDCHEGRCFFSAEYPGKQGKVPHGFAWRILYKCGITGAKINKLDRKTLIYALRNRRTYATTGARILLDFSISGIEMGEIGKISTFPEIMAEIHTCMPVRKIEIIRNGKVVKCFKRKFLDGKIKWKDKKIEKGKYWYYLKVYQIDGEVAWSSPIWLIL